MIFRLSICNKIAERQDDEPRGNSAAQPQSRPRRGDFRSVSAIYRPFGERDAEEKLPGCLRDLRESVRSQLTDSLKIPAQRRRQTNEEQNRRDREDRQ